jgi:hypothetical protein
VEIGMRKVLTALMIAAAFAFAAGVADVAAWGDDGHQIVARIAARKLTLKARQRIVSIARQGASDAPGLPAAIGKPGDPLPSDANLANALAAMAIWPDHIQPGGKGATAPWHFIDIGLFEGPTTTADRCPDGCVTEAIDTLIAHIKTSKSIQEKPGGRTFGVAKELRFLIHFMGDIHQPLHAVTNADAGGNCEVATGFNGSPNLHSVWDSALVRLVENSSQEATATALIAEFGSDTLAGGQTDPKQMAAQSFALAKADVYPKIKPSAPPTINHFVDLRPEECSTKAPLEIRQTMVDGPASFNNAGTKKIVRQQLFRAGVRLATVLNALFM